jgi:hypothetical protein
MLARLLTTILPAMTLAETIETTRVHHVAGLNGGCTALTVASQGWVPRMTSSAPRSTSAAFL